MDSNNNGTPSFMDTMMDAQKQLVDTVVSNTRKLTNGNANPVTETVEKGTEWYKNWLEAQKATFARTTEKATEATNTAKTNAGDMTTFFQNWMNSQQSWGRQLWEMNTNWMKTLQGQTTEQAQNPMEFFKNASNNFTSWMNNANTANNWMNSMNSMNSWMNNGAQNNPFSMDALKGMGGQMTNLMGQWNQMSTQMLSTFQDGFKNGNLADTYRNMLNSGEGFARFASLMQPMWDSIQNNTFTKDMMKNWTNPAAYQELMDKYFGFLPAQSREHFQQMTTALQGWMKQNGGMMTDQMNSMRSAMSGMMPAGMGRDAYGNMLNMYEQGWNAMQEAASPIVRMMTPNAKTKSMLEWSDLMNRMVVFSIKNSELQYLTYTQGTKVMEELGNSIMTKMQNGEEIKSMMTLYQEWLNISDKSYISLFESDEYSQLMAEVSALQMKLRKDMEHQMEKSMSHLPIATRTELDELYKTIYDLKKQVRQMERMMELSDEDAVDGDKTAPKPAAAAPRANNNPAKK